MSLQKESEWEKEFEKVMGCIPECANGLYEDVGCPAHGYDAMKTVKFFRKVLSNREKEIADEVKDSFWECPTHGEPNPPTNCRDCNECLEVNVVLSNVLKILKHQ